MDQELRHSSDLTISHTLLIDHYEHSRAFRDVRVIKTETGPEDAGSICCVVWEDPAGACRRSHPSSTGESVVETYLSTATIGAKDLFRNTHTTSQSQGDRAALADRERSSP